MIITFFDTETTGLSFDKGHRIIEIALIGYDLEKQTLKFSTVKRVNPGREIDAKAQLVHKISSIDLIGKPSFALVEPIITKAFQLSQIVVAHNLDFDVGFICGEYSLLKKDVPTVHGFCTMENSRWATSFGKNANLGELCYALDVDYKPEEAHSALYDTQKLAECFFEGRLRGGFDIDNLI